VKISRLFLFLLVAALAAPFSGVVASGGPDYADEVAVYATPLTSAQVSAHREAGDFSLPVDYTYDAAVSAGLEVPPTASEAGLSVCPVDDSGFDGYATFEEAEAAGDKATLQANDEPECVPDRSETQVTIGGMPRHLGWWLP
jgi:hypothetical protein